MDWIERLENHTVTIYDSTTSITFPQYLVKTVRDILQYRFAWSNFVKTGLRIRYRRSVLGFFWSLLNPLISLVVIATAFSFLFNRDIKSFGVFLFAGMLPYQYISNSIQQATLSLINAEGYLKKVYLPQMLFPLIAVSIETVNFIFSLFALYIIALFFGATFSPTVFLLPIVISIFFFFNLGVGMFLSVLNVFFRDTPNIVTVLFSALFYATPVIYTLDRLPENLQRIFKLNPLLYFVKLSRLVILGDAPMHFWDWMIPIIFALVALLIGCWMMMKSEGKVVYRL